IWNSFPRHHRLSTCRPPPCHRRQGVPFPLHALSPDIATAAMNKNIFVASLIAALITTGCARREEAEPVEVEAETATPTTEEVEKQVPAATIAPVTAQI